MRILLFLVLLFNSSALCAQQKQVISEHKGGEPKFVVWFEGEPSNPEIVKEEAYYEDGTIEYTGYYKNGLEDGVWVYYYENGNKKLEETYHNGLEHGIRYEYAPDGSLRAEIHFKKGKQGKEIRHK